MDYPLQRKNYEYFQELLPELLKDPLKMGKVAVVHDEQIKGIFDTDSAAFRFACSQLYEGFVIQDIIDESEIVSILSPVRVI